MRFNPEIHHRRSIRLKGFDYSRNGAYFVTMCSWNRECLFGEMSETANGDPEVTLSQYGEIVRDEWMRTTSIRKEIDIGEFIIMPNHFHGIVYIHGRGDRPVAPTGGAPGQEIRFVHNRGDRPVAPTGGAPDPIQRSIGSLIAGYKSAVTKQINILRKAPGVPIWQRNYYERSIRDEIELDRIIEYIIANPANWIDDENHPGKMRIV